MAQPPGTAKASAAKAMFEKAAADSAGPAAGAARPAMLSRAASHAVIPGAGARTLGVSTGGGAAGGATSTSPSASPTKPSPLQRAGSFSVRGASPQPAAEPAVPEWQLKRQAKIAAAPPTVVESVAAPPPAAAPAPAPVVAAPKPVPPSLARMGTNARLNSSANLMPGGTAGAHGSLAKSASPGASPSSSPTSRTRSISASPQPQAQEKEEPKEDPNKWIKNPPHLDGVGDMSALIYLDPPNILWNLQKRYEKAEIYTAISKVLVAINPYEMHDVYSGWHINEYRRQAHLRLNTLPPHVFSVAQQAYHQMEITDSNQSMIVCGESGSGKTESAKHLMRYFAFNSKKKDARAEDEAAAKAKADLAKAERDRKRAMGKTDDDDDEGFVVEEMSIEAQVLAANPILEAFGNAKTVLNNNSSRFGKFTKLVFDEEHPHGHDPHAAPEEHDPDAPPRKKQINPKFIVGSFIETYLLEKSRVCKQEPGERNYHVFYHLCSDSGLAADVRAKLFLESADKYVYLQGGGTYTVDGINDGKLMKGLQKAMAQLKINPQQQQEVFQIVSGVLHLGNIKFKPINADSVEVDAACANTLKQAAQLFAVDEKKLNARLTTRNITVSKNVITKPLSKADADQNRDAMAKALYNGLFLWIVHKINAELYPLDARKDDLKWIGILDVFGFESFANNSFEQFCINFANETLQQYFNTYILSSEQDEYRIEGIFWKPIKVPNNQDVLDLIDLPPKSILATLDSACRTPKADDKSFISSLFEIHRKHPRLAMVTRVPNKATKGGFDAINGFSVKHYAGTVIYNAKEFLPKNADSTHPDTIALFSGSQLPTVAGVFADHGSASGRHTGFISTGYVFSQQLRSLMNLLHQTTPYFVRCVKPNPHKKPRSFLWDYTRPQLECGGLIEALRILKLGYPTRVTYVKLYERYGRILKPEPPNLNKRDFSEAILVVCGKGILDATEYQLGLTKVFFRPGKQSFLEDLLHSGQELSPATVKEIKKFLLHKRVARARASVKAHARFTLRLRRMRGLVRFRKLSGMMTKAAKAFFTPLKRIRQVNAAKVVQAHILMHMHAHRYDALKRTALRLVVIRRYHRVRVALKKELDKRIAVKREIARKQKEEEERMAALQKIEDDLKEAKHGFANLTGDEKVLESDLIPQLQSGELVVAVIARIAPNFKLKPVVGAKSPIQIQENWSMAIRGMTGLGITKKYLNFTGDDGAKGDRDVFVAKVLPGILELIKIGYARAPALRPKVVEPAHDDDHHDAKGSAAHVEVPTAAAVDKSELLPPLKVGPTGDGFFALLQRGGFFGVYRSGGGAPAAEKEHPVRAFVNAADPGVLSWRGKDEAKTELGKIDMNLITAVKVGREDGNDVDPNPPAAPAAAATAAAAPAAAAGASAAAAAGAADAKAGDAKSDAKAPAAAGAAAPKVRGWLTVFCGADAPALVLQADTTEMRDQWVRALRYCLRNVREFKTLARPKGDPLRGNLTFALLMEELDALKEHKESSSKGADAAAKAAAEKAAAEAKAAAESEAKAAAAAAAAEESRKAGEKAAADLRAAEQKFEAELAARTAEFEAKLKAAETDRKASAEVQQKLDAYEKRVAELTAKVLDLEKNPPLPPPEVIKQRQIIEIEQIFTDATGPAKPLHADLDLSAVADEKQLRDTALQLHRRNTQLEDAVAVAKLYFSGYLHMNDSRVELKQFTDKHVRLTREQLDAAALGLSSSSTDAAVERDMRAGELQAKARRIKAQREMMKTMRIVKHRRKRSPSQGDGEDEKYARPPTARALFAAAAPAPAKADSEEKSAEPPVVADDVIVRSASKSVSVSAAPAPAADATAAAPVDGQTTTANGDSTTAVIASPSVTVRSVATAKAWSVGHVSASHCFNRMTAFGAPLIVDTRAAELYRAGHIPGSISMPVTAADVAAATPLAELESRISRMEKMQFSRRGRRTVLVYGEGAAAAAPAAAAGADGKVDGKVDAAADAKDDVAEYVANALHAEAKVAGADVMTGGFAAFSRAYPFLLCAFSEADAKTGRHRHQLLVPWYPSEIVDGFLYLGNGDDAHNYAHLKRLGISRILNCTAEVTISEEVEKDATMKYKLLELSDDEQQDIASSFDEAFAFIDSARADGARVLVHCAQGISRSATVVIAYLIKSRQISLKAAFDMCKAARPKVLPNAGFWEQLQAFEVKHWPGAKGDVANSTLKDCVDLGLVVSPHTQNAAAPAANGDAAAAAPANGDAAVAAPTNGNGAAAAPAPAPSPSRASHDDSESEGDESDDDDADEAAKEELRKARATKHALKQEHKRLVEAEVVKKEREQLPAEEVVKLEWFEVIGRACADADTPYVLGACFEDGRGVRKDLRKAAYWYEQAAQRGSGPATHALAMFYAHGKGVAKDEKKAVELLNTAATGLRHTKSMFALGVYYSMGKCGLPRDMATAVSWYRKAADAGHVHALFNLAVCHLLGQGVGGNKAERERLAVQLYEKAAALGYAGAQFNLGVFHANGSYGVPKDQRKALLWYDRAARQGYPSAAFNLASCYAAGNGIVQDAAKAARWYEVAASAGHANAQFNLALCYDHGTGVPRDEKKAFEWYSAAAKQGHAKAQYNLGLCYRYGRGTRVDLVKAADAYEQSAAQGYVLAQYNLAAAYSDGKGVAKDQKRAADWYSKAAEQKYPNAQYNLAVYYVHGTGVPKDDARAFQLFVSAAAAGNARAQRWAGVMYDEGKGTAPDPARAFELLKLAANAGDAVAQHRLGVWYRVGRPEAGVTRNDALASAYLKAAAAQGHVPSGAVLSDFKPAVSASS